MTLAERFDRLTDNHVHAREITMTHMGVALFYGGQWVRLGGRLWRVWGYRNDSDVILLY